MSGPSDFYTWDGLSLFRRNGSLPIDQRPEIASRDGQYFIDRTGRIWNTDDGQTGVLADWGKAGWGPWSIDNRLCGTVKQADGTYELEVVDIHGQARRYNLGSVGPMANIFGCNPVTGRAAVLEGTADTMAVIALSDGHTERTISLGSFGSLVPSADARWLAVGRNFSNTSGETDVVDLSDGATVATLPDRIPAVFSPDGRLLVVTDLAADITHVIDWRAGTALWSRPGHARVTLAESDLTTDKVLIDVATGSAMAGTNVDTYWVVDGRGAVVRFTPAS